MSAKDADVGALAQKKPWRFFFSNGEFQLHEDGCWMDCTHYDALQSSYDSLARELEQAKAALEIPGPVQQALNESVRFWRHQESLYRQGTAPHKIAKEHAEAISNFVRAALKPSNEVGT